MNFRCPGQDNRNLRVEFARCPQCGYKVEFFSDEMKILCPECKNLICREKLPSCIDWCKFAKECVGGDTYNRYIQNKTTTIRQKLINELEKYFSSNKKRINHAKNVLRFAEELLKQEKADWNIVIPCAILHDVGIKEAERKYASSAGYYQEKEGPAIARDILLKIGFKKEDIEEICEIIAHHHSPGKINSLNFKVLYDADWLVNLKDEVGLNDKNKLRRIIEKIFLTNTGKKLARKEYSK